MPRYHYTIGGRNPGYPKSYETYHGSVDAATPKDALVLALADQFGDPDDGDAVEQLTTSGWMDREEFDSYIDPLPQDATNLYLESGDNAFDVEVQEIGEGNIILEPKQ